MTHAVQPSALSPWLRVLLAGVLALSLYTAWQDLAGDTSGADRLAVAGVAARHAQAPPSAQPDTGMAGVPLPASPIDLFPRQGRIDSLAAGKAAPAIASAAPSVAESPRPPPLPLRVAGLWHDADGRSAVLSLGTTNFVVRASCPTGVPGRMPKRYCPGDVLPAPAADYRVAAVDRHRIVFEYLPLKARQALPLDAFAIPSNPR